MMMHGIGKSAWWHVVSGNAMSEEDHSSNQMMMRLGLNVIKMDLVENVPAATLTCGRGCLSGCRCTESLPGVYSFLFFLGTQCDGDAHALLDEQAIPALGSPINMRRRQSGVIPEQVVVETTPRRAPWFLTMLSSGAFSRGMEKRSYSGRIRNFAVERRFIKGDCALEFEG
ncbi:unnamed protein product [Protopolystoma xenopodis]|uniref:Uncharacterized protein n=1 Tax=Protopolystoma xenopodis TaxID=117903 RepID=A0A3S4ZPL7_9PLAT|nr:unnamed protein product [Protopolystoma xenopodis]